MTPAQFRGLVSSLVDADESTAKAIRASLSAELLSRGLESEEAAAIIEESFAAELVKREAARLAARASKLSAIRTALGLP